MEFSWPVAVTVLIALGSQIIVAAITVRLAFGRFRNEQWWEKKYEAYHSMLTSLHRLKRAFSDEFEIIGRGREATVDQEVAWKAAYDISSADLKHHADLGEYLLSKKAAALIQRYGLETREASRNATSYSEYLDGNLGAISRLLDDMKVAAKADLKGTRWPLLG